MEGLIWKNEVDEVLFSYTDVPITFIGVGYEAFVCKAEKKPVFFYGIVVGSGPMLTHGEIISGAGIDAAQEFKASEIMDSRPFTAGS